MNERIEILKEGNKLEITINSFYDKKKQNMLLVWIFLFSLCGIAIFTQFFEPYDAGTKVFFGIYVAFWLFFEFKVIYVYRWRKYGIEKVICEKEAIFLIKTIGRRGITQRINKEEIKKVDFFKDPTGKFIKSMNTSYWNISKYHLAITIENDVIPFAIDIENKDAKTIIKEISSYYRE